MCWQLIDSVQKQNQGMKRETWVTRFYFKSNHSYLDNNGNHFYWSRCLYSGALFHTHSYNSKRNSSYHVHGI